LFPEHIAHYGRRPVLRSFLRIALVADVGPQFVAFDAVHVQPDHHAVVQFGRAASDGERQPGNCLAVGVGQARDGALTDALTEGSDNLSLLVERKDIHGTGPIRHLRERPEATIFGDMVTASGPNPGVADLGTGTVGAASVPLIWLGASDSDRHFRRV